MSGKTTIDFAEEKDNQAILSLSHRCPQHGVISGYPDRSPVFARIHQQLSKKSFHKVARLEDDLIGCFGGIYTNLQYKDINYDSAYLLDLKVAPEFRRSLTAFRLVKETVGQLRKINTEMAIATFLKDNDFSLIFSKARAGIPEAHYLGDFRIFSIVPIMKKKVSKEFLIENPTENDIPELIDLYNNFYSRYKLAPRMTEDLFRFYMGEIDGMDLRQFWVARKEGTIKAVVCAWDEDAYKRWYVVKMTGIMKFLSFVLKVAGLVFKMPQPIKVGKPLHHKSIVMAAHDQSVTAIHDLLTHINNIHRGKDYTILQTHFHDEDPVNEALKGLIGFTVHAEAHIFTEDPELARTIAADEGIVHFEWPMWV